MLNSLEIKDFVLNTIMSLIYHKYILNKTDIFESLTSENVTQDYLLQFCRKFIYDTLRSNLTAGRIHFQIFSKLGDL